MPDNNSIKLGLVEGGTLLQTKHVPLDVWITIGTSEKNTLTLKQENLPARFRLIGPHRDAHVLYLIEQMQGKVGDWKNALPIDSLKEKGGIVPVGNFYQMTLGQESRGNLNLGIYSILFTFPRLSQTQETV